MNHPQRGLTLCQPHEPGDPTTMTDSITKQEAIALLGGSASEAARRIGVTPQAVILWPDGILTDRTRDRVQAALWRASQTSRRRRARGGLKLETKTTPPPAATP